MADDLLPEQTSDIPAGYAVLPWHRGFGRMVGPLYERGEPGGGYTRAFRVEEHHTNGMSNAHGGMLMTFADMAWGHAVDAGEDFWWVTVRLVCDFLSSAALGEWVEGFVDWYHHEHLHSAIRFVTPEDRHSGREEELLKQRHRVYERARRRHPRRWSGSIRNWQPIETVYLNPEKKSSPEDLRAAA